ncbi:MAG: hypothetical protein Q7W45_15695 [Bacteroidota bacterium]|nr:hypothetical protein [Bacteroidota bacterium]MDP3145542.1 hypothetical protein [Bacteroidota bacterium]MDP3557989.1 hypothetical protein [Bacteroidota bacterium]
MNKLFIIFLISALSATAQDVHSSKTYIQTCYHNQQCFSLNNTALIFYKPDQHELIIVVDFAKFKIGNDTLDEWLDDLDDSKLIFKGHLNADNLLSLTQHNSKAQLVNGMISFNGVTHAHTIELTLFEIPREGMLFKDNQNDYFDRINANLQFGFYPKEFKINKKPHHLKKKITLAVYRGYVNPFKQGMEHWITN